MSDSANGLQKQLTDLYKYASLWHIIISIPKTIVLIFNKRHTTECDNFYYGDSVIEKAGKYKYPGVIYITKYTKNVLKKKRSFLSLPKLVRQFFSLHKQSRPVVGKLSSVIAIKVFDCQILPILEYASDISDKKLHLKFIKSILGVRKQTPTPAIYGDTERFPLIIRQHIEAVKYWCRILYL